MFILIFTSLVITLSAKVSNNAERSLNTRLKCFFLSIYLTLNHFIQKWLNFIIRLFYPIRPTLPLSKQASGNLLKKAVTEAHLSVNKPVLSSSLKYDPTSPPSPIRSHSYEEKQQQKELLLQQHRELQKQFFQMKQAEVHVEHEDEAAGEDSDKELEEESTELDGSHVQSDGEKRDSKEITMEEHKELADAQQPEVCYRY